LIKPQDENVILNDEKVLETLLKVELEIKDSNGCEIGVVVDRNGKEIYRVNGQKAEVEAPPDDLVKNNVFTHNHPSGNCAFSNNDIYNIVKQDGYELRAVTSDGRFVSLRKNANVWDANILSGFSKVSGYRLFVKASQLAQIKHSGQATPIQINKEAENLVNEWLRNNAEKYGYIFTEGVI
jgi:hypothetical protein